MSCCNCWFVGINLILSTPLTIFFFLFLKKVGAQNPVLVLSISWYINCQKKIKKCWIFWWNTWRSKLLFLPHFLRFALGFAVGVVPRSGICNGWSWGCTHNTRGHAWKGRWMSDSLCVFWTRLLKYDAFVKSCNYLLNITASILGFDLK